MNLLTIICPTYNEENYIVKCIDSVIHFEYLSEDKEILFVDGMSEDQTRNIIKEYMTRYPFIKLLDNPKKTVPFAMNIGIKESKGSIIIRIDAHCVYPSNYAILLVQYLKELRAENVGAVLNTLPAKENSICRAIAAGSSHIFGVGRSLFRIGANKIVETDTVPFGCFNRKIFDQIGLFDEDLIRNQDDEFNARIIKNKGKIFLIPQVVVDYIARDTLKKMAKMYYQYGLFKPLVNKKIKKPATIRQFFPPVFVLSLVFATVLSFFSKVILLFCLIGAILYFLLALLFSIDSVFKYKDGKLIFILPVIFFIIHFSYGLGYWIGLYKTIVCRK